MTRFPLTSLELATIIDLQIDQSAHLEQAAALLLENFSPWPSAWSTHTEAIATVHESIGSDRISRIAINAEQQVLGWIGGCCQYNGYVWELHPLVVHSQCQRRGIGRALVGDLEMQVSQRGGLTLWLGTDDEADMTSVAAIDLYPNPLEHLQRITNLKRHPFEFYQKVGFSLVGIMPDANGIGKPDIYMAKRVTAHHDSRG